ncbi:hypothetical protein C1646_764252 [Rhizophagus diaphanus]|nr:hypothetical protein C1646_764252 [Rhizophagus diaphanus] [Rhizophagus sp. MUCL 43196]
MFQKAIRSGYKILHWYGFAESYDKKINEICTINKVKINTAKQQVYQEVKKLLPDISDVNLHQQLSRARKLYKLFNATMCFPSEAQEQSLGSAEKSPPIPLASQVSEIGISFMKLYINVSLSYELNQLHNIKIIDSEVFIHIKFKSRIDLKVEVAKLRCDIDELKEESKSKKKCKFQTRCIQIAKEVLNEEPVMQGLELDAFFQKYKIALEVQRLSIGFIILAVWYDEKPEIIIPKRIQKIKEFVYLASKSFDIQTKSYKILTPKYLDWYVKLTGLLSILTDKIRSNLYKRYKKETGYEPCQIQSRINYQIRLRALPILEIPGIDNYNFASPQPWSSPSLASKIADHESDKWVGIKNQESSVNMKTTTVDEPIGNTQSKEKSSTPLSDNPSLIRYRNLRYNTLKSLDDKAVRNIDFSEIEACSECNNNILTFPFREFT